MLSKGCKFVELVSCVEGFEFWVKRFGRVLVVVEKEGGWIWGEEVVGKILDWLVEGFEVG